MHFGYEAVKCYFYANMFFFWRQSLPFIETKFLQIAQIHIASICVYVKRYKNEGEKVWKIRCKDSAPIVIRQRRNISIYIMPHIVQGLE